jgi:hypothetical protein
MQIAVLSSKNPECITLVTASAKQTRDIFSGFFHSPAGFVLWQVEALGDVQ